MSRFLQLFLGLTLVSLSFPSSLAFADEDAIALLNRMNKALHQLTYKGTLAYLRGDSLSTLKIDHTVVNGVEREHVVRLNEAGSEVSRELKGFSLASIPQIRPEMKEVYSFDLGRENRIANIPCVIITARPKDRERYLQKYCIDPATGMLLDYMLVGKSHKPVEQFMFTTIEIIVPEGRAADRQACETGQSCAKQIDTVATATMGVVNQAVASQNKTKTMVVAPPLKSSFREITTPDLDDGWVMEELPAGYEIRQAPQMKEANDSETKHYIVSDGLSSLSVFVSPLSDNFPMDAVKINSGALNVVSQRKAGYVITVVGEVPESTLKNIVNNLKRK